MFVTAVGGLIVSLSLVGGLISQTAVARQAPVAAPATRPATSAITLERIERGALPLRGVLARIDLTDPAVKVISFPAGTAKPGTAPWPTTLETVAVAAERENVALAVNGDFFAAERTVDAQGVAVRKQYIRGKKATPTGNAVSGGKVWARAGGPVGMVVVDRAGKVSILRSREIPEGAAEVVSGNRILVENGVAAIVHKDSDTRAPRTAAALTADGKTLLLLVVDGRSIRSRGTTLGELATLMVELGAHTAVNLDGGGSTTLVSRNDAGKLETLNVPSDGEERPVANALGIRLVR